MVDLDRLHEVINHGCSGRGCGKTYAQVQKLAGFVGVGAPRICCIITRMYDFGYIFHMIQEVFEEQGLDIHTVKRGEIMAERTLIKFIPERDFENKTRGYEGVMIYMRHWD